jgi:hypothetical protein
MNLIIKDAKHIVSEYLNKISIDCLPAVETKKLSDLEKETLRQRNSFLGWKYVKFKKLFQERNIFNGLLKAFSSRKPYSESVLYDAFATEMNYFDSLSNYYGNQYRGSFVVNYILGALAVLLALVPMGFSFEKVFEENVAEVYLAWCTWIELFLILVILLIHKVGTTPSYKHAHKQHSFLGLRINRRWHEKWIEYRILAERFRYMEILYPIGLDPLKMGAAQKSELGEWYNAYYAALLDSRATEKTQDLNQYKNRLKEVMKGQKNYHQNNAEGAELIHHRLHTMATWLFYGTLAACACHFVWHTHILTLIAGFFPALAAAMHGIIASGEYSKNSQISERMHKEIESQLLKLDAANSKELLTEVAMEFHNLVIGEALSWKAMFMDKNVPLA